MTELGVSRKKVWIAGLIALVVGGIGAFLWRSDLPVRDLIDVTSEGGEKLLREPLRPARGAPRVVVLALDGVGAEEIDAAIVGGRMPALASLMGGPAQAQGVRANAYTVPDALSILPSTTYAAWASTFTGEPAGRTGVPGNEWFTRESRRFFAPAPVSVSGPEDALEVYSEDLIGQVLRVPTLYERADVRAYVSLASVFRGADVLITPDPGAIIEIVAAGVSGLVEGESIEQEAYEQLDRSAMESLLETLRMRGIPDLQIVYFPGVDLYTHIAEPPLPAQRQYLAEVLDPQIGLLIAEYERQGALEDTYFVIVSDHGHTPVINDDRHALGTGDPTEPSALLELAGFRVRPFTLELDEEEEDYQAVLAYQGAIAYVYLADRSTCPEAGDICDWSRPPRLDEDVMPVARTFRDVSERGNPIPELLGTLDLVFARQPRPTSEPALPFQVLEGDSLVPIGGYLARTPRPDLLALEERLEGLATGPYGHRAGDVLLLARSGAGRPIEDRFYFSGPYHSWHGSPDAQDSRIAFIVANAGSSGAEIRDRIDRVLGHPASQLDVVPVVLRLLGIE